MGGLAPYPAPATISQPAGPRQGQSWEPTAGGVCVRGGGAVSGVGRVLSGCGCCAGVCVTCLRGLTNLPPAAEGRCPPPPREVVRPRPAAEALGTAAGRRLSTRGVPSGTGAATAPGALPAAGTGPG